MLFFDCLRTHLLIIFLFVASSVIASSADLSTVKSTLKAVERSIKAAVSEAEALYEQNKGKELEKTLFLLSSDSINPFLTSVIIKPDYEVQIVLYGANKSFTNTVPIIGATGYSFMPLAKVLQGVKIRLIPIYEEGDVLVSYWECLTSADNNLKRIGVDTEVTMGSISFISKNGYADSNVYLSNCIYIADKDMGF